MDASIKPIRDADSDIYALIFEARDITQHRESQEMLHQAQKTEVIGQLTSGVAHDFNNILAVIGGNLEMSTIHSKPEERRNEHIDRALDAVFRGRELTQQLLAFSRKRRLQRQYVDVVSLIEESLKLVDLAILNDVEIVADMEDGTWSVLSDPSELQTAILNLIVNSKDAMPEGGTITVKTANLTLDRRSPVPGLSLDPGDYVLLSVVDEGTGIPPEILNRVAEPYYTTKSPGPGTGLGLSMVNHFARETGGAMHIASTVGTGTTATLYLPRSVEAERPHDDVDGASENEYEALDNHILVVEDDAAVRRNVVTMLRDMGYETTEAESGDAAFEMLSNGLECDLVFSDIALPGERSGRDLAREISKFDKEYKVLLTTGVPDHKRDWRLKQSGVPILEKPYRYHELADAIRNVLSA
jgi:nitrogen-specific signal transduction histidine kinase